MKINAEIIVNPKMKCADISEEEILLKVEQYFNSFFPFRIKLENGTNCEIATRFHFKERIDGKQTART